MPVGRVILKSISDSKKLPKVKTDGARLLYTWLLTHLDVNGCFSGDPQVVKGKVFTRLDKSTKTVESYLKDLEENKLIIRYEIDGDIFLNVPDFVEKQPSLNPNREGKSSIPTPSQELLQSNSRVTPTQVNISKVNISKVKYADFVSMTEEEFQKLADKHGRDKTMAFIEKLNVFKGSNGKTYKSDYLAILNWVIEAVNKNGGKNKVEAYGKQYEKF